MLICSLCALALYVLNVEARTCFVCSDVQTDSHEDDETRAISIVIKIPRKLGFISFGNYISRFYFFVDKFVQITDKNRRVNTQQNYLTDTM